MYSRIRDRREEQGNKGQEWQLPVKLVGQRGIQHDPRKPPRPRDEEVIERQERSSRDFSVSSVVSVLFWFIGEDVFLLLILAFVCLLCFLSWGGCNRDERGYGGAGR